MHGFARLLGQHPSRMLGAQSLAEQRSIFETEIEPLFSTPLIRLLSRHSFILYSLGIPPSQFASLVEASSGDLAGLYCDRLRHLACDFALSDNYFAWQAFGRRYGSDAEAPLPPYLQRRNYHAIRARLSRVTTHTTSMTAWLVGEPAKSYDRYILLDSVDWMDAPTLTALWQQIRRTARPGARVIFRTAGARSPLDQLCGAGSLEGWRCHADEGQGFLARDRSAIYGGFHLYSHD
jgi:S-adenosylmethionine-diacylglycerol 3-amino-3-carboxypropyl transferase